MWRRFKIAGLFLFLFGLPLFGTLGAYWHAHSTMRSSAIEFVKESVPPILENKDWDEMYFLGTLTLKGELAEEEFADWFEKYGEFESLGEWTPTRSTVGVRSDQAWQYVDLECRARFSAGEAELHVRAARRSTVLPEWRIEEFDLSPVE